MKILFVTNTPLGRPELASIQYFSTTLAESGHTIGIVGRNGGNREGYHRAGVQTFEAADWTTNLSLLRCVAKDFRPDVVHVFIHAGCGLYPLLIRTVQTSKFVLDIRSPLLRTGIVRRLIQAKNLLEVLPYDAIGAHGVESAWTVVGKGRTIHWLPPGMALGEIPWKPPRPITDCIRAVYVGSLNRPRKVTTMIEAVVQANKRQKVALDIYGYGSEFQTICSQVRDAGLADRIRVYNVIPRHELFARLVEYDVGLSYVPHQLYDSAPPLKTAEYLAAGLAVIATDTIGNRIFIRHGENGILAGETPTEFSDTIVHLASNPQLRTRIANHARSSVAAFDWTAIVQNNLLPLYEQLLGQ